MISGAQLEIAVRATGLADTRAFLNSPSLFGNAFPWVSCPASRTEKNEAGESRTLPAGLYLGWLPAQQISLFVFPSAALGGASARWVSRARSVSGAVRATTGSMTARVSPASATTTPRPATTPQVRLSSCHPGGAGFTCPLCLWLFSSHSAHSALIPFIYIFLPKIFTLN